MNKEKVVIKKGKLEKRAQAGQYNTTLSPDLTQSAQDSNQSGNSNSNNEGSDKGKQK